jgi:hypothetical protein
VGKRLIHPNQETILQLPYSEVCMHLHIAGARMRARLLANGMVQLLQPNGHQFSFPITAAEAGLDYDQHGWYSVVADPPDPPHQADPLTIGEHRAALEAPSEPLAIPDRHRWGGAVVESPGPLSWHPELGDPSGPDPDSDESQ